MLALTAQHTFRFAFYEELRKAIGEQTENKLARDMGAAAVSAVVLTSLFYPLDLCHTRMSADLTKKQGVATQQGKKAGKQAISNR